MQSKLTLRLDDTIIQKAKEIARKEGKSLSKIVEDFFLMLTEKSNQGEIHLPSKVRSLKGLLRDSTVSEKDYQSYLEKKHQ